MSMETLNKNNSELSSVSNVNKLIEAHGLTGKDKEDFIANAHKVVNPDIPTELMATTLKPFVSFDVLDALLELREVELSESNLEQENGEASSRTKESLTPQQQLIALFKKHNLTPSQSKTVYNMAVEFVNPDNREEILLSKYGTNLDDGVLATLLDLRHERIDSNEPATLKNSTESILVDEASDEMAQEIEIEESSAYDARSDLEAVIGEFIVKEDGFVEQGREVFQVIRDYSKANSFTLENVQNALALMKRAPGLQGEFANRLSNNLDFNSEKLGQMNEEDLESFINSFGL